MSEDVDDAIAALYQSELDSFIGERKALAARLKKAGDKAGAERVSALSKPTPSAWATNRASVTARHAFVSMLRSGVTLRSAMQKALRGETGIEVTALQREQREAIEGVVAEAQRLLDEAKAPATHVVMGRVRTNLTAIGMTGRWGDAKAACLSKDLPPLDIGALASLLDEHVTDDTSGPKASSVSEGVSAHAATQHDVSKEVEAKSRLRKQRIDALLAEVAEAARTHEMGEKRLVDVSAAANAAEVTSTALSARAEIAEAEATRLESLATSARDGARRTRREADASATDRDNKKREREKAQQEATRQKTHWLALRDKLERAQQDE